ncbi:MAG: hypothetical protein FWB75_04015, partial [Oscillospiraceae bacterium]|nr:hypothetical protein [Oscillospiraceae bacterium]
MKKLLSRSCAVFLALLILVSVPMTALADPGAQASDMQLPDIGRIAPGGSVNESSSVEAELERQGLTRAELEELNDFFFGPEGLDALEEQLQELRQQWNAVNEQLLTLDSEIVTQREETNARERRVRDAEARHERAQRRTARNQNEVIGEANNSPVAFGASLAVATELTETGELSAGLSEAAEVTESVSQLVRERSLARGYQARLEHMTSSREALQETLISIEAQIDSVHEAINQAWENFDLANPHIEEDYCDEPGDVYDADEERESCEHEYYDECFCDYLDFEPCEVDCDCPFYFYDGQWRPIDFSNYIDEYGNFWHGVDMEWFDSMNVEFEPFDGLVPPAPLRMSDEDIAVHAARSAGTPIPIANSAQLVQFINRAGAFYNDAGHFVLQPATAGYTFLLTTNVAQGRPGTFTGVFDGNGHTIQGYRFRPAGTNATHRSIGFIQEAGHGAVIRNVNFNSGIAFTPGVTNLPMATNNATNRGTATTANSQSVWYDTRVNTGTWRTVQSSIGIVIGRATDYGAPAGGAVVTIDNVRLIGQHEMRQWRGATAQNTKSIGGMVGSVE